MSHLIVHVHVLEKIAFLALIIAYIERISCHIRMLLIRVTMAIKILYHGKCVVIWALLHHCHAATVPVVLSRSSKAILVLYLTG